MKDVGADAGQRFRLSSPTVISKLVRARSAKACLLKLKGRSYQLFTLAVLKGSSGIFDGDRTAAGQYSLWPAVRLA